LKNNEINELAAELWSEHEKALSALFLHRPGLRGEIANNLRELIDWDKYVPASEQNRERNIVIFPKTWNKIPVQQSGNETWGGPRVLGFQFENLPEKKQLDLMLIIGPSSDSKTREELAKKVFKHFRMTKPEKRARYKIKTWLILTKEDFEKSESELFKKIKSKWNVIEKEIKKDVPKILKITTVSAESN